MAPIPKLAAVVLVLGLGLVVSACGGSGSSPSAPTQPNLPIPQSVPASDRPLAGVMVRVDGLGETPTAANGAFHFDALDAQQVRGATIVSPLTVERATRLKVKCHSENEDERERNHAKHLSILHSWVPPPNAERPVFQELWTPGEVRL